MVQQYDNMNLFDRKTDVKVLPIKRFFAEMGMDDIDYDSRVELATKLSKDYDTILKMMVLSLIVGEGIVAVQVASSLAQRLTDTFEQHLKSNPLYGLSFDQIRALEEYSDFYLLKQIQAEAEYFIEATLNHLKDEYYFSTDRATLAAENEVNSITNYTDYAIALIKGMTRKTWHTMDDGKVRETHRMLEGKTIPIYEPFDLLGSYMKFPKDESLGADKREIAGCRCWATYSY